MNRVEFMRQLEQLLHDIPDSDRTDAIDYYNSYFDEAGVDNEASVIQELGSPGKVAGIIKADLRGNGNEQAEYTETGYQDNRNKAEHQVPSRRETGYQEPKQKSKFPIALVIVILVFTFPIWSGLFVGILGLLLGIAGALLGIVVAAACMGAAFLVGGIVLFGFGIYWMFSNPAIGCLGMGGGLLMFVVGILAALFFVWLTFKWLPMLFRWFVDACHRLLDRSKGGAEA